MNDDRHQVGHQVHCRPQHFGALKGIHMAYSLSLPKPTHILKGIPPRFPYLNTLTRVV